MQLTAMPAAQILDQTETLRDHGRTVIHGEDGLPDRLSVLRLRQLALQRAAVWIPPRWPDPAYPPAMHLDFRVNDADQAERDLLTLGASRVPAECETGFQVFTDPVGHPFCIV